MADIESKEKKQADDLQMQDELKRTLAKHTRAKKELEQTKEKLKAAQQSKGDKQDDSLAAL